MQSMYEKNNIIYYVLRIAFLWPRHKAGAL